MVENCIFSFFTKVKIPSIVWIIQKNRHFINLLIPVYAKECGEKNTLKLAWLPFATVLIKLSSLLTQY